MPQIPYEYSFGHKETDIMEKTLSRTKTVPINNSILQPKVIQEYLRSLMVLGLS